MFIEGEILGGLMEKWKSLRSYIVGQIIICHSMTHRKNILYFDINNQNGWVMSQYFP